MIDLTAIAPTEEALTSAPIAHKWKIQQWKRGSASWQALRLSRLSPQVSSIDRSSSARMISHLTACSKDALARIQGV